MTGLALWFDLTCPHCAGELELRTASPPHEANRRATAVVGCTECRRSSLIVLEVQRCATIPDHHLPT